MLLPGLSYASPCGGSEKTYIQILNLNPTKQMMTLICTGLGFLIGIVVGVVIQSENGPNHDDFE
jgi:hypothetical protein